MRIRRLWLPQLKTVAGLRLTRKCDADTAWCECEPDPLSGGDPINHHPILVLEARHGPASGHGCTRCGRNVIAAEVGDLVEIADRSAAGD